MYNCTKTVNFIKNTLSIVALTDSDSVWAFLRLRKNENIN
jgi:hypothetical protein